MAINKLEAGDYIGYIHAKEKPTLYFENGHFTQIHDYENNIGWHSNGVRCHYDNLGAIGQSMLSRIYKIRDKKVFDNELKNFIGKFKLGEFKSSLSEAVFFECFLKGKQFHVNQSKFRLVKKDDMEYNKKFSRDYINDVLSNGSWAVEEHRIK